MVTNAPIVTVIGGGHAAAAQFAPLFHGPSRAGQRRPRRGQARAITQANPTIQDMTLAVWRPAPPSIHTPAIVNNPFRYYR